MRLLGALEIVYSGAYRIVEIFANFANYRLFAKIVSANVLFYVDKDRAIALIRENIIREMLYVVHSQKFYPVKISRFTVFLRCSNQAVERAPQVVSDY